MVLLKAFFLIYLVGILLWPNSMVSTVKVKGTFLMGTEMEVMYVRSL